MILRALLALIACLLALLPAGTLASIPRTAFVSPPAALLDVEFSSEQDCGPLTLHLDGLHDRGGPCGGVLVRQNPWSAFDPEGLSVMDDWNDSAASLCAKGGFLNHAAAYGICFGSTALNAFSLGSFGKNCRVQDQVASGQVSTGKGLTKMVGNSAVAGASLAVGGGAGSLVAKGGGSLVAQGAAFGFAQSTSQIAGERGVAAVTGTEYDGNLRGDAAMITLSTGFGAAAGKVANLLGSSGRAITLENQQITQQTVDKALLGSDMQTAQDAVSGPVLERYLARLAAGEIPPPIKVDGKVIVEGNHRYITGRIAGKEPAMEPGTLSPSQASKVKPIQETKVDPTDWGNQ